MSTQEMALLSEGDRLRIVFKNSQPLELADVAQSLYGIAESYQTFMRESGGEEVEAKLFIQSVENGSMIIDMAANATVGAALLWKHASLYDWSTYFRDLVWYLSGKSDIAPKEISQSDVEAVQNIVKPIAKDQASQLIINASEGSTVTLVQNTFQVTAGEAERILYNPRLLQTPEVETIPDGFFDVRNIRMTWVQANFERDQTGNKARFEGVTQQAIKVKFADPSIQEQMFHASPASGLPWQEWVYLVDAQIKTVNGRAVLAVVERIVDAFDPAPQLISH